MNAVSVASLLSEFGGEAHARPQAGFTPFGRGGGGAGNAEALSERMEAARASGFADGEAAAKAALELQLAQEREAHACELAAERQAWASGEGRKLAEQLAAGLGEIEAGIEQAAARVLAPVLQAELRRHALAELQVELDVLLTKDAGISVTISGPEDLLESLRKGLAERLPGKASAVICRPSAEPEVRIAAGQTVLETRLAAWAARIEEAIG